MALVDVAAVGLMMVNVLPVGVEMISNSPLSVRPPPATAPENVTQVPVDAPYAVIVTTTCLEPLVVANGPAPPTVTGEPEAKGVISL